MFVYMCIFTSRSGPGMYPPEFNPMYMAPPPPYPGPPYNAAQAPPGPTVWSEPGMLGKNLMLDILIE